MGTIVVGLILAGIVALIIRSMVKNKKEGRSSCSCGCDKCSGGCH